MKEILRAIELYWLGQHNSIALQLQLCRYQTDSVRLYVVQSAGYAPKLNPQEQVWNILKRRELEISVDVISLNMVKSLYELKNAFAIGERSFNADLLIRSELLRK